MCMCCLLLLARWQGETTIEMLFTNKLAGCECICCVLRDGIPFCGLNNTIQHKYVTIGLGLEDKHAIRWNLIKILCTDSGARCLTNLWKSDLPSNSTSSTSRLWAWPDKKGEISAKHINVFLTNIINRKVCNTVQNKCSQTRAHTWPHSTQFGEPAVLNCVHCWK